MWRMTVIMLVNLSLGACVAFPQQEPEEFGDVRRSIRVGDSTKVHVINVLGEPQWEEPRDGTLYYSGKVVGQSFCGVLPVPAMIVIAPIPYCETDAPENWWIKIALDDSGVVSSIETKMEAEASVAITKMRRERLKASLMVGVQEANIEAAFQLATQFHDDTGLRILAEQGDREAAVALADIFGETQYLMVLAEQGDREAAFNLVTYSGDISALQELADNGDLGAATKLKEISEGFDSEKALETWKWRCKAANVGHGEAQSELGNRHRTVIWAGLSSKGKLELRTVGVHPDNRIAYMWYTLAIESGDEYAPDIRSFMTRNMTNEDITQAEQMARDWKPGDCPSAEHRLGPPGET